MRPESAARGMVTAVAAAAAAVAVLGMATVRAAAPADPVDALMHAALAQQRIPGATLLVARAGRIIRAGGYGLANVELRVPAVPATVFQSGSLGKQFTATAVLMLAAEGRLQLDDPLTRYFPDAPAAWRAVTIRHLLCHTGGFGDYPADFDMRRDYTEEELLRRVESLPLAFAPGTDWAYANLGYLTLGILIHRVSGEFYGDFLEQRIFVPLGMHSTRIISESDIVPNRAAGYRLVNGALKNQEWVAPTVNTTADGSLYFSVLDLARWDAALYSERLLPRHALEQMWRVCPLNDGRPNSGSYGFGWFIHEKNHHHVVEHEGSWQGFETYIGRYTDDRLTVAVLDNLVDSNPEAIADQVATLYLARRERQDVTADARARGTPRSASR
jgi:CubicO group peptidase (beta-lactamase class C family)